MKYIFFGKVHPERAALTITKVSAEVGADDTPFKGVLTVSIILSQVVAELDTDASLSTVDLRNTVENFVHTMVDVYGYLKGYAYSVELHSVYVPEKQVHEVFGTDVTKITKDEKSRPLSYQDVLQLALMNPEFYMVLKDLRDAIKQPLDTSFHCRRATETIMRHFMKSSNKAKGWKDTIKILNVNEDDINEIKESGKGQRHGEYKSVSGDDRVNIMIKTWRIVDKFAVYLKLQGLKK